MSTESLSPRMTRSLKHLASFMESSVEHVEVLYFLSAEGGEVPRAEVLEELEKIGLQNGEEILESLRGAGLVRNRRCPNGDSVVPILALAPDLEQLLRLPAFYRSRLRYHLQDHREEHLAQMADNFYAASTPFSDADRPVLQLARFKHLLKDSELFRAAVEEHFDMPQRVLLKVLAMNSKGLTLKELRRHLGFFGHGMGYDDLKANLAHIYRSSGLVFSTGGENLTQRDQYYAIDSRVRLVQDAHEMLRTNFGLTAPPRQIYPEFSGELNPESWKVVHDPLMLFHNVQALLVYVISHRVTRIQKGGIHKGEARRINARLLPPQEDSTLLNVLVDFLQDAGVLKLNNRVWAVDVSKAAALFRDAGDTICRFFLFYFDADPLQPATWITRFRASESGRTLDAVRALWVMNHLSARAWITTEDVAWLYIQSEGGGGEARLATVEGFIRQLVTHPLHWLGLVDVSRLPEDGGIMFRLSDRGRALLLEGKLPQDLDTVFRVEEKLIVQSNLEVFTPVNYPPEGVMFLARFADFEKGRFRISNQSLSRGFDSGLNMEQIVGFLEKASSSEIPQNVRYMLADASARHGHILVDPQLRAVKCEDHILQKELSLVPALKKFWLAGFRDTILLMAAGVNSERVVEELRRLGYMPRIRWESVITRDDSRIDLSEQELKGLLALIRAFELSDRVDDRLSAFLLDVDGDLSPERRELKDAIPQRELEKSYEELEDLNRSLQHF